MLIYGFKSAMYANCFYGDLALKRLIILLPTIMMFMNGCTSGATSSSTPISQTQSSYQFVIDAGSSGSRIYVYNKLSTESGVIINDLYESKVSIPLASFANNASSAGNEGIQPLLISAINFVQLTESGINLAQIQTSVLGTAGMRLLTESQQEAIYRSVADTIAKDHLTVNDVETITGQYEGIYSWADVNYLSNNFATQITNGVVEVGGASAQIVFATTQSLGESIVKVAINNKNYNVYSSSFLGLGQDSARKHMDELSDHDTCYPVGYEESNRNIVGAFSFAGCAVNYSDVLSAYPQIDQIKNIDGFAAESFVGVSSVYYALNFWGIESQPQLLSQNINNTCSESFAEIKQQYPNAYKPENQCANAILVNNMLFTNLSIRESQLKAVNTIKGTSLTWTLGYALLN